MPPSCPDTKAMSLKATLKVVHRRLGERGREAIKEYVTGSGLEQQAEAMQLIEAVFGVAREEKEQGPRTKGSKAKG